MPLRLLAVRLLVDVVAIGGGGKERGGFCRYPGSACQPSGGGMYGEHSPHAEQVHRLCSPCTSVPHLVHTSTVKYGSSGAGLSAVTSSTVPSVPHSGSGGESVRRRRPVWGPEPCHCSTDSYYMSNLRQVAVRSGLRSLDKSWSSRSLPLGPASAWRARGCTGSTRRHPLGFGGWPAAHRRTAGHLWRPHTRPLGFGGNQRGCGFLRLGHPDQREAVARLGVGPHVARRTPLNTCIACDPGRFLTRRRWSCHQTSNVSGW